jgi:hypothetical protein
MKLFGLTKRRFFGLPVFHQFHSGNHSGLAKFSTPLEFI